MQNHDDAPRRNEPAASPRPTNAAPGRTTRLTLSIGSGVLSLAALQSAALAGPCGSGVQLESPDQSTIISYDGAVSCIILPGGDALLSLSGQVTPFVPLGAPAGTTTYTYDASGLLPVETDSLGTTTTAYDSGGRPTETIDPLSRVTTYTYDHGDLAETTQPSGVTTYQYDPSPHRLTTETDPLSHVTTFAYDAVGMTVTETAPGGLVTTFAYDAAGNILSEIDPLSRVTTFIYDADGQVTNIIDPLGDITTYVYDAGGVLQSLTDLGLNITTFVYDAAGGVLNDDGAYDHVVAFGFAPNVPEPSTLALFLSGLAAWAGLRRTKPRPRSGRGRDA